MLNVEVSLLRADRAAIDWIHGSRREEIVDIIVEHCVRLVARRVAGSIQHVSQSNFSSNGITVRIGIAAHVPHRSRTPPDLDAIERSLESNLQTHLGWRQAAVSVQIEAPAASEPWPLR